MNIFDNAESIVTEATDGAPKSTKTVLLTILEIVPLLSITKQVTCFKPALVYIWRIVSVADVSHLPPASHWTTRCLRAVVGLAWAVIV